jgi:hypothetical protein
MLLPSAAPWMPSMTESLIPALVRQAVTHAHLYGGEAVAPWFPLILLFWKVL